MTPMSADISIEKVAKLARLRLTDEEIKTIRPQISGVLDLISQLEEVDTSNVTPLPSVIEETVSLRKDAVTDGNCQDNVLKNATDTSQGFYSVPKVVE